MHRRNIPMLCPDPHVPNEPTILAAKFRSRATSEAVSPPFTRLTALRSCSTSAQCPGNRQQSRSWSHRTLVKQVASASAGYS